MFSKSTFLHLRFPFSWFLLPVYLFAVALSPNISEPRLGWVFFIVHFLLYPASNGYNSYFDKDEDSIGGLRNPPKVNNGLYAMALLLDALALVLGFWKVSPLFAWMLLGYGLVSKAYSHPLVRLKKYPIIGWLTIGFFQGCYTFMMCYEGINQFGMEVILRWSVLIPGLLSSIMLWASYPMTQIYQHDEDEKHGDMTISRSLGIRGTFHFTGICFTIAAACFFAYFHYFHIDTYGWYFLITMSPVAIYFLYWYRLVRHAPAETNFSHTMALNWISSTALNVYFVWLFLQISHVGEYLF